jgi:hypothetical protein
MAALASGSLARAPRCANECPAPAARPGPRATERRGDGLVEPAFAAWFPSFVPTPHQE